MSVKDDIAKADKITELDGKIDELEKEIAAIIEKYKTLRLRLESEMDTKIKTLFQEKVNDPSLPECRRFVSIAGCSNEIERKQTELKSLEEYLLKHQKTLQEFEKQGIKLEYAQLDANMYNAPSGAFQGIGIEPLLSFIFG